MVHHQSQGASHVLLDRSWFFLLLLYFHLKVCFLLIFSFTRNEKRKPDPRKKMPEKPQACLFLIVIAAFASPITGTQLPYEVLDSIIELTDTDDDYRDLNRVNVSDVLGPTRPIYRLDLGTDYVAYYEIDTGSDYVVLSSGHKTGDFREVESGPDPRPTDVVIQQAQENGQQCEKFYRLSPLGLIMCENGNGTVVAASYNWTNNDPQVGLL